MPHEIVTDTERLTLRDVIAIGQDGETPPLRFHRLANGDAVMIAGGDATRNGLPLLGQLAVVRWGEDALVRCGRLRVVVEWHGRSDRRRAEPRRSCRLCFGAFAIGEFAVACPCEALFHEQCDGVRVTCPGCGRPGPEGGQ